MQKETRPDAGIFVIFGGAGDLTWRKLVPALYNLFLDHWLPEKFWVLGLDRAKMSSERFVKHLHEGVDSISRRGRTKKEQSIVSKDPIKTLRYLKAAFLAVVGLMLLLIAATPLLVPHRIALFDRFVFEENAIETVLILVLFALAYLASRAYRTAVAAYKKRLLRLAADRSVMADRLSDAFRYIGTVNVQLQEIHSVFSGLKRLPENRRQFKDLMGKFVGKILGMMNVDWVTIRIIDQRKLRTIAEHREVRNIQPVVDPHIGNRAVAEGKPVPGCVIVTDAKDNLSVVAACILPLDHLDKEEAILMQALVGEIEMLFIISNLYPALKEDFFTKVSG